MCKSLYTSATKQTVLVVGRRTSRQASQVEGGHPDRVGQKTSHAALINMSFAYISIFSPILYLLIISLPHFESSTAPNNT